MPVLSRRVGERIVIADGITVTVCRTQADEVRLGIESVRDIRVERTERKPKREIRKEAAKAAKRERAYPCHTAA